MKIELEVCDFCPEGSYRRAMGECMMCHRKTCFVNLSAGASGCSGYPHLQNFNFDFRTATLDLRYLCPTLCRVCFGQMSIGTKIGYGYGGTGEYPDWQKLNKLCNDKVGTEIEKIRKVIIDVCYDLFAQGELNKKADPKTLKPKKK